MKKDAMHIDDPTMRVKAPTSMLNALGNAYVNAQFAAHGLEEVYGKLTGLNQTREDPPQPTSVMGYVRAVQEYLWEICAWKDKIQDFTGDFVWTDNPETGEPELVELL